MGRKTTSTEEERYLPFVRKIAEAIKRQINPPLETDELVSLGFLGLQEALGRYNPEANVKFETYAYYRIRGSMFEGIARQCQLSRHTARKLRMARKANDYLEGASADIGDETTRQLTQNAAILSDIMRDLTSIYDLVSVKFRSLPDGEGEVEFVDEASAAAHEKAIASIELREAIDRLPSDQRQLLQMYYFDDMTLEEAGKKLGVTKSWACKLHHAAIRQMRRFMKEKEA